MKMEEICNKVILTIKEEGVFLSVLPATIRNEIKRGRLKALRFGTEGRAVRILREDLLALIETTQAVPVAVSNPSKREG